MVFQLIMWLLVRAESIVLRAPLALIVGVCEWESNSLSKLFMSGNITQRDWSESSSSCRGCSFIVILRHRI